MQIYLTRHGRTQWNQERRFQGMYGDSPLLPTSYEEVRQLGQHLTAIPFEAIYVSPSKRTLETAKTIQQELATEVPMYINEDLREMGYGQLEGQQIDEMYEVYGEDLINLRYHLDRYDPSAFQGETPQAMIERMERAIKTAIEAHEGPILIVGHGASLTAAIRHLLGKSLAELRSEGGLQNYSLTILEMTDTTPTFELALWDDRTYITEE